MALQFDPIPVDQLHDLIVKGLRSFFKKAGCENAVLGLSGGIDSAVVAALAVEAFGKDHVTGIMMPSQYSTLHSISDAVDLANNLGIRYYVAPIEKIYDKLLKVVTPFFEGNHRWDTTQENLQARIRATILMAYANRRKALLLNTTNKSELSMGYGTLYGDLAGALMVIADVYKLQVYDLANYINLAKDVVPRSTISKAPSAELAVGQKDTDTLPPYSELDPILYSLNEAGMSPEKLIENGVDKKLVDRILKIRARNGFKTIQVPPVLKISSHPLLEASKCFEIE
ncbi:MAG: NAD(+) synthase [Bacteroidales bacterium]|nr:NAD(+) synthase [Bacteroidales bacterium]